MLVLSRKKYESIVIDDTITITVLSVNGRFVRLGIEAPKEVGIKRSELVLELDSDTEEAGDTAADAA